MYRDFMDWLDNDRNAWAVTYTAIAIIILIYLI